MRSALAEGVDRLIAAQSAAWPLLARGIAGLRESVTRRVRVGESDVLLRHVPHRIGSTTAAVDPASIAKRPCFLCAANMPPEEEGIAAGEDFTAYANPFPILESHLTIVHREHRPQAIAGHVGAALRIAEELPEHFVLYNGPECGASAPDHLHLQACAREVFPIGEAVRGFEGPLALPDGRRLYVLRGGGVAGLSARVERLIASLKDVTRKAGEPLLNLAFYREGGEPVALVFPRAKHRPRSFETGKLTVSPATVDMSGVLVVPLPGDFERITASDIRTIYDEVTLAPEPFAAAWARMERGS